MSEEKVKACPFCGSGVETGKDAMRERWYIQCTRCGGCYESPTSEHRCAIGWNNRQLAEYETDDEGDPVGCKIVAIGDDGSVLCENHYGKRVRYQFAPKVAATQMETAERDVHFAIVKYQLYLKHGLGVFDNWYTWKKDKLIRSEVVESLTYPVVRKNAESEIRRLKNQIKELEELMAEASAVQAEKKEGNTNG